jgi:hypothetical protein
VPEGTTSAAETMAKDGAEPRPADATPVHTMH